MVYEHNEESDRAIYVSNSDREDVVKAMKEFIIRSEGAYGAIPSTNRRRRKRKALRDPKGFFFVWPRSSANSKIEVYIRLRRKKSRLSYFDNLLFYMLFGRTLT